MSKTAKKKASKRRFAPVDQSQTKPLEDINQELAGDPLEARWFAAGDRMKARPQPKCEWE